MLALHDLVAIDAHTHATVSTRHPPDPVAQAFDAAMAAYCAAERARVSSRTA